MVHKEFDQARLLPGNQDPVRKSALDRAEKIVLEAGVVWPAGEMSVPAEVPQAPRIETTTPLEQVAREYGRKKPHTPAEITAFNQVLVAAIGEANGGILFSLPILTDKEKAVKAQESKGRGILAIPEGMTAAHIAKAYKLIGNEYVPGLWSTREDSRIKQELHVGYRALDVQVEAPHLDTTQAALEKKMRDEDAHGMNLSEYLYGSLVSKLATGYYLDERTLTRLLGSSRGGQVVSAGFNSSGYLIVVSNLGPQNQLDHLGGRLSAEVK